MVMITLKKHCLLNYEGNGLTMQQARTTQVLGLHRLHTVQKVICR